MDLKGIVAKRRADAYDPGTEWVKVSIRSTRRRSGATNCSIAGDTTQTL